MSSVTTMYSMFDVRSAHALAPPSLRSRPLSPCMLIVRCRWPVPSRVRPTTRSASYALLWTRQRASAFNQPLSFDTSSVKYMNGMFEVRSAHALAPPSLRSRALSPCMPLVRCRRLHAPPPSAHTSLRIVRALLSTRQAASVFNQPLSFDTSSVTYTTMGYMFWVRSAYAL